MLQLLGILNLAISIYIILIFFRIILTWFSWDGNSGLLDILSKITDPFINWFRRFQFLRIGLLDLSPIAAIAVLSLFNSVIGNLILHRRITAGLLLALILQIVWGLVSFILGFLIVILILRLIAHLSNQNLYSPFWRIIDSISRPVLEKINLLFFKDRIISFMNGIVMSIVGLVLVYLLLRFLVLYLFGILAGSPI
ncbi:MAG: YggT family protein [Treponema sp.]|nr:YggT family protein [Treponema sp.]